MYTFTPIHFPEAYSLITAKYSEDRRLQESRFDESVVWRVQVRLLKTPLLICKQVRATADDSFSNQVESGVCDILHLYGKCCCNRMTIRAIFPGRILGRISILPKISIQDMCRPIGV